MKVGELKKLLEKVDDNIEVIAVSHNYELNCKFTNTHVNYGKYKRVNEQFRDDFEHEYYSREIYRMDKSGNYCVAIFGD